ncbi:hypothetical protein EYF80_014215 [Liparis tanakae]|uniref:Uncharacterized protein n=1 Tax=Liparis tanakae TaxID=230148 RepID=A0A4Z2IC02_9TELE|nr:hypothetical protein EYF80_014215 [Liparis tanakae]
MLFRQMVLRSKQWVNLDLTPDKRWVGECFVNSMPQVAAAFVINMVVFFVHIELDPVVKTGDLLAELCFSHKHMIKLTGI